MTISSPLKTKKEYAEKPFTFYNFRMGRNGNGHQFTIEEDLKVSQAPRSKKEQTRWGEKEYAYIKVSDGLFHKDLKLSEYEFQDLCLAIPESLVNYKGVTLAFDGDQLTYISAEMPPVGNGNGSASQPATAPQQPVAKWNDGTFRQLADALILTQKLGTPTDGKVAIKIAETIIPGDALGLIAAAKTAGWVTEDTNGIHRGVV